VGQFLATTNVMHGNENNVAADTEIRVAGMIAVKHRSLAFFRLYRSDEQIVADLNFDWTETRVDIAEFLSGHDVAAFHRHNFVFHKIGGREQAMAMDWALVHLGLWR
jgi:hypothetical protein